MASIEKAAEIIDANPELADFVGPVPFEEVWVAEGQLEVTFPQSYREFLQRYGAGSFGGRSVYGLGVPDTGLPSVVYATQALRESDDFFPGDLVVVEDTGEGDLLCLATSRMNEENECPVVQWIPEMSFEEQMFEVVNRTFAGLLLRIARRGAGM
ncbi:MAG TPA: SMI1/KNR4 family protein [Chloroflexia bacterium]|nr:SMI1/KNR4 family protein [Chloroflexia bacterium]